MLDRCRAAGAEVAEVTLHVGLGTFAPLRSDAVEENTLHYEQYSVAAPETEPHRERRAAAGHWDYRGANG